MVVHVPWSQAPKHVLSDLGLPGIVTKTLPSSRIAVTTEKSGAGHIFSIFTNGTK
jgi:hypothetical protein